MKLKIENATKCRQKSKMPQNADNNRKCHKMQTKIENATKCRQKAVKISFVCGCKCVSVYGCGCMCVRVDACF